MERGALNADSSVPARDVAAAPPATLGDVLYAGSAKAPPPESDWVALVNAVAVGDQNALHALYERAHRVVFTLSLRISGSRETAEEITLDVFHDVWRRAARYDAANGTVVGWIMNLARSRAIDRIRFEQRKKRVVPCPEDLAADASDDSLALLELRQQGEGLRRAIETLGAPERQAIEAAFFGGLTHAEAAVRLGQPLGTIKTRIRSGLHKLRQALAAQGRQT